MPGAKLELMELWTVWNGKLRAQEHYRKVHGRDLAARYGAVDYDGRKLVITFYRGHW